MKIDKLNIGAVFVLYNPTKDFRVALDHVKKANITKIVIVDNSPTPCRVVENLFPVCEQLTIIQNYENYGVARALNLGCKALLDFGCDAALLMDQDSVFETGDINVLIDKAFVFGTTDIGALVPKVIPITADIDFVNWLLPGDTKFSLRRIPVKDRQTHILFSITSGSLISLSHWKMIGEFDERLFIEYVDTEYCLRLKMNGFKTIMEPSAKLFQRYGDMEQHKFFYITFNPTHHAPLRYYYLSRNKFLIWKKIFRKIPGFILWDFASGLKRGITILLFERQKFKKLYYSALGFRDFIFGRWGKYD